MLTIAFKETGKMTTEAVVKPTPAEIKQEMIGFILSLGYVHPAETSPGVPNPLVQQRESGPKSVTYDLYSFPNIRQRKSAIVITNSDNDVVIVNFEVGDSDSSLSKYFEVNNVHDRQNMKDFLVKYSR